MYYIPEYMFRFGESDFLQRQCVFNQFSRNIAQVEASENTKTPREQSWETDSVHFLDIHHTMRRTGKFISEKF